MTAALAHRAAHGHARHDARGYALTGADAEALAHHEQALGLLLAWRGGADGPLAQALAAAPGFVMAHVLQAWMLALGRDTRRIRQAHAPLARARQALGVHQAHEAHDVHEAHDAHEARGGPGNERERLHVAAIEALLADDYPRAKAQLCCLLEAWPRDVLALHAAHALDYLSGDIDELEERVARVLPAWRDEGLPGRHAVLAMHAFGLVERGEVAAAERAARAALALNPMDARAHHVMAHVFETSERAAEGVRWFERHAPVWSTSRAVATHCAWHLALFHLALGDRARAVAIHDRHILATQTGELADLIDASALLWRLHLAGGANDAATQRRAAALAEAWAPHLDDGFCSFSDIHAMLAFVGARDEVRAARLLRSLQAAQARPTRHGATTRELGLPACRALVAFSHGNDALAVTLLAGLPATAHRLGGSHAQRDVLHLTLMQAVQHLRKPSARRPALEAG